MTLQPWQKLLIDKIKTQKIGSQLMPISYGRGVGKSYINTKYFTVKKYTIEARALVDGEQWYTVRINMPSIYDWLCEQNKQKVDLRSTFCVGGHARTDLSNDVIKVGTVTVTYKTNHKFPGVKFPVLHRVVYAHTVDHVDAFYQRSYLDHRVDAWLSENCRSPYYHSPGYLKEKFIEFECDEEALMFALKWS